MTKNLPQALFDIYVSPSDVFTALKQQRNWSWLPLVLILVSAAVSYWWFYSAMTPQWIVEQQLLHAGDLTPAELQQTRAAMGQMADKTGYISAVGVILVVPLMFAIMAFYLKLVANAGHSRSYGDWYAFTVWSNIPMLINTLGFIILFVSASDKNLPLTLNNYASLNQLFLNLPPQHSWFGWADNFNLFSLWTIALTTIGLKNWSQFSTTKALLIAALPTVVIFGVWLIFI